MTTYPCAQGHWHEFMSTAILCDATGFRDRLGPSNDPVAGSRILSYRIGKPSPQSLPVVAAVRLPDPGRAAATRSRLVV